VFLCVVAESARLKIGWRSDGKRVESTASEFEQESVALCGRRAHSLTKEKAECGRRRALRSSDGDGCLALFGRRFVCFDSGVKGKVSLFQIPFDLLFGAKQATNEERERERERKEEESKRKGQIKVKHDSYL
jgi:hypothetical protein